MKGNRFDLLVLLMLCLTSTVQAEDEGNWRTRAFLEVAKPGIAEAVVPPELVSRTDQGGMDFQLIGPDGHARAFELYWREPVGRQRLVLAPSRVRLDPANGFIWETEVREKLVAGSLEITLAQEGAMGKIDVFGRIGDQWSPLARDAAIFTVGDVRQARVKIPEETYDGLRLLLKGYDREAHQTLLPIETVVMEGVRKGKDYARQEVNLPFRQSGSEGRHVIEAVLPGDGLWISAINVKTEAQFQGSWQAGRERIVGGSRRFDSLFNGRVSHVGRTLQNLDIDIHQPWPGHSLVLNLDAEGRYIGKVVSLTVFVRLPRLVFAAEKSGRYTARTGMRKGSAVLAHPGDSYRRIDSQLGFSSVEKNPGWRLTSLVEKFQVKGGPFDPTGYTWRAPVPIPEPGFYRLALNRQASLALKPAAIRLVRDDTQVPYVNGRLQDQAIDLEIAPVYDAKKNISTWTVHLPQASPRWRELNLYAGGIFKRRVELQKPKTGTRAWETWRRVVWENRGQREGGLHLSLRDLPGDVSDLRLIMSHGDNQPVVISRITAVYSAPTVYFLAHLAGDYTVYGGNPGAAIPQYDLSLVQAELFSALPDEARMGDLESFRNAGWQNKFSAAFTEKGWGLYAVLGLVTLVLIIIIARMFPKSPEKDPS